MRWIARVLTGVLTAATAAAGTVFAGLEPSTARQGMLTSVGIGRRKDGPLYLQHAQDYARLSGADDATLIATHRSHASHASHASHRSSTGSGGYSGGVAAPAPAPAPAATPKPTRKAPAAPMTLASAAAVPLAAKHGSGATFEDMPTVVQLEGGDPSRPNLTFVISSQPAHGMVCAKPTGRATYTPDQDFNGSDAFSFSVTDGVTSSAPETFTITVHPVNDAPTAQEQVVTVGRNKKAAIVLAGTDVDGDRLTFEIVDPPGNGTLSGDAPSLTYQPNKNYVGSDLFTFRTNDGKRQSGPARVAIVVGKK
jgi:hypothetical protein